MWQEALKAPVRDEMLECVYHENRKKNRKISYF